MDKERKNKRRLNKKERSPDLKIYSPTGELIFVGHEGFCVDFQELLRQKKRKSQYSHFRGSY